MTDGQRVVANSVLPAHREPLVLRTADGLRLVGETAVPVDGPPAASIITVHPLPTHGGMMDSHVLRKMAWRLPAMADTAVLRFNTRGTTSAAGSSEGSFDEARGEGVHARVEDPAPAALLLDEDLGAAPVEGTLRVLEVQVLEHGVDPVAVAADLMPVVHHQPVLDGVVEGVSQDLNTQHC